MEWIWVKNEAVNDVPGRIPAEVLPAFEARGWVACPAPVDDPVAVLATDPVEELPEEPARVDREPEVVTPSSSGQKKKEN